MVTSGHPLRAALGIWMCLYLNRKWKIGHCSLATGVCGTQGAGGKPVSLVQLLTSAECSSDEEGHYFQPQQIIGISSHFKA